MDTSSLLGGYKEGEMLDTQRMQGIFNNMMECNLDQLEKIRTESSRLILIKKVSYK